MNREECVIFGSGPSINNLNINLEFFDNKDFIGCNFIHENPKFKDKVFKFYSLIDIDYSRSADSNYFKSLECDNFLISTKNANKFSIKTLLKKNIRVIKTETFNLDQKYNKDTILRKKILFTGNSLPFLIQFASFIAKYKTIYLYGVDHFDINDLNNLMNVNFDKYKGRDIKKLNLTKGKLKYINSLYKLVSELCSSSEIKVINITPNSKLEYFEKSSFKIF